MKLAVVCANGKAGKLIVKEALDRGLDVLYICFSSGLSGTIQAAKEATAAKNRHISR